MATYLTRREFGKHRSIQLDVVFFVTAIGELYDMNIMIKWRGKGFRLQLLPLYSYFRWHISCIICIDIHSASRDVKYS